MSDNNGSDSELELSCYSSWTILNETPLQNNATGDGDVAATEEFVELYAKPEAAEELKDTDQKEVPAVESDAAEPVYQGCATLEEYAKEHGVEPNCDSGKEKPEEAKPDKSKRKKGKAESFANLAVIGTVLAVAGVSFLCLLTPNNYTLTSKEIETIQNNSTSSLLNLGNKSVPAYQVLCGNSQHKLAILDKGSVLEECFKKNEKSVRAAQKYLKNQKELKSLTTFNLLNDAVKEKAQQRLPPDPVGDSVINANNNKSSTPPTKTKCKEMKTQKRSKNLVIKSKVPPSSFSFNNSNVLPDGKLKDLENVAVSKETKTATYDLSQGKVWCNVLQDLMLLRMTGKAAQNIREKNAVKKTTLRKQKVPSTELPAAKQVVKHCSEEKPATQKVKKHHNSALNLQELPFSRSAIKVESRKSLTGREKLTKHNNSLFSLQKDQACQDRTCHCENKCIKGLHSVSQMLHYREKDINKDLENLRIKQGKLLEKLYTQQCERAEFLQLIRERQQRSVQAVMNDRKMHLLKSASGQNYSVPTFRTINEYATEQDNYQGLPLRCCSYSSCCNRNHPYQSLNFGQCCSSINIARTESKCNINYSRNVDKFGILKEHKPILYRENYDSKDTLRKIRVPPKFSLEYFDVKKKYYERIGSYWQKREEYLNKRIQFIQEVSESINEIMQNYRYNISRSDTVLQDVVIEAIAAFPNDAGVQELKTAVSNAQPLQLEEASSEPSHVSCCSADHTRTDEEPGDGTSEKGGHGVFRFTAVPSQISSPTTNRGLYDRLFGRKGQHIRKRDLALWGNNRVLKRKRPLESSKLDVRRLSENQKAKKEL